MTHSERERVRSNRMLTVKGMDVAGKLLSPGAPAGYVEVFQRIMSVPELISIAPGSVLFEYVGFVDRSLSQFTSQICDCGCGASEER